MSSLLPLACFAAAIALLVVVGATGAGALFWLGRSPRFRRGMGGSERVREAGGKRFFVTGDDVTARTNALRELAAKRTLADGHSLFAHTFEDGDSTTTHIVLRVPISLPQFTIATRTFFAPVGLRFDAEFSERYLVEGADESALRKLLTPEVRRTIIDTQTWRMESDTKELLFKDLQHTTVEGLERFVDDSLRVLIKLGSHLETQLNAPPPTR